MSYDLGVIHWLPEEFLLFVVLLIGVVAMDAITPLRVMMCSDGAAGIHCGKIAPGED